MKVTPTNHKKKKDTIEATPKRASKLLMNSQTIGPYSPKFGQSIQSEVETKIDIFDEKKIN